MAVASLRQPRSRAVPQLVAEHNSVKTLDLSVGTIPVAVGQRLKSDFHAIPMGSKLLRFDNEGVRGSAASNSTVWGIPLSPDEFMSLAAASKHPFAVQPPLPDVLLRSLSRYLQLGPAKVARVRAARLKHWIQVAEELRADEEKFHADMHPQLQPILAGKRLLLFQKMMAASGCPDVNLVHDMAAGFPVVGFGPNSHAFRQKRKLPQMSEPELLSSAAWTRHSVLGSTRSSGDAVLDDAVWAETTDEVSRKWLIPVLAEDLDLKFGSKVRPEAGRENALY